MKTFTKKEIAPILVIFIMAIFAASLYAAPCVKQVPTHWNASGQIDGWSSKAFAALFFPGLTLVVYLLMLFLPKIDPLRKNYQYFEKQYYFIRLVLVLFFAGLFFFSFFAAMGHRTSMTYFMVPFFGIFFIILGSFLPSLKRNWFVGIRTPWTLQSDEVWIKTHKFAGKSMMAGGILTLFTVFLRDNAFWAFLVIIIISALLPVLYSFLAFKKHGNTE